MIRSRCLINRDIAQPGQSTCMGCKKPAVRICLSRLKIMNSFMRGKAYRRHKFLSKWIRRAKYYLTFTKQIIQENGEVIENPSITEFLASDYSWCYKTTGTPCSCPICSSEKYNREKFKKETKNALNDFLF